MDECLRLGDLDRLTATSSAGRELEDADTNGIACSRIRLARG
jgi:hypothetical protein